MPSKNNPHTSGYFHVNFIPCLIALLITQSAHLEYSSVNDINQVRIYTPLLTFSLLLRKMPLCRPKIIPIHRDISEVPCEFHSVSDCTLITQSAHREYSSVNDINDIYSSIMSCF